MSDEFTAFLCTSIGVAGTTRVFVRKVADHYVARVGIAIMGSTNRKDEDLKDADPFDEHFNDNYAEGTGNTEAEAIEDLKRDIRETSETLWL